jgi:hypothetical protein
MNKMTLTVCAAHTLNWLLAAYLTLLGVTSLAADQPAPDLTDIRAIHMGGNWGNTYQLFNDPEDDALSHPDYINWLKSINANWVGISVALHVSDTLDSSVERAYGEHKNVFIPTFTDDLLQTMIQELRANGIHVYLTLAFELDHYGINRGLLGASKAHEWGIGIEFDNWPWALGHPDHESFVAEFWQSYTDQAVHFATLAESLGVEMFSLGTETDSLFRTRLDEKWPTHYGDELVSMVSAVRSVYSGLVTYDSFFDSYTEQGKIDHGETFKWLWQDLGLDVIGISAYFPLTDTEPTSKLSYEQIKASYQQVFTDSLQPVRAQYPDIPIIFLEYGYSDSIRSPFVSYADEGETKVFMDNDANGLDDGEETQANIFRAFYEVNKERDNLISGAFLWGHEWTRDDVWEETYGLGRTISMKNHLAESIVASEYGTPFNSGMNDAWYDPTTDGQGFFITVFPDLGFVSLAWFTYDTVLPPEDATANLGDPGHRWITALGLITGSRIVMNIDITSNGIFNESTVIEHTDPAGSDGTIILTFNGCNSATVEFDITSINRQGTIPIKRVANDNIVVCEALSSD